MIHHKRAGRRVLCMVALAACFGAGSGRAAETGDDRLVLHGATIVDTHDGTLSPGKTIVIEHGAIAAILSDADAPQDAEGQSIDAHGRFVVPGYLDMHAHLFEEPTETKRGLMLMLANGITGWRQMTGTPEWLAARREGKLPVGKLDPELLLMPGTILTPFIGGTPARAADTVRQEKLQGADFIKVGLLSPSAFFAALAAARQNGLPFAGHLQNGVDAAEASKAGMTAIEHLGPGDTLLFSCSTDEAALREPFAKKPPMEGFPFNLFFLIPFKESLMKWALGKLVMRPSVLDGPDQMARFRRVVDTYSEEKCRQLAAVFIANGTWQVPTLIRDETSEEADALEFLEDPNLRYVPADEVKHWRESEADYEKKFSPADRQTFRDFHALRRKVVKLFDEAGVKMLAGDDGGGTAIWVVPGFGLHREFDELEKAGLTPLHVLQMTTLKAAEFLGRTSKMGSVEQGKTADLVLLDANPMDSVQNLHKIDAVVRAGHYFSRKELDGMLEKIQTDPAAVK